MDKFDNFLNRKIWLPTIVGHNVSIHLEKLLVLVISIGENGKFFSYVIYSTVTGYYYYNKSSPAYQQCFVSAFFKKKANYLLERIEFWTRKLTMNLN